MIRKHLRRKKRFAIGLAFAALAAAPTAQAMNGITLEGPTPGVRVTDARHAALLMKHQPTAGQVALTAPVLSSILDRHVAAGKLALPVETGITPLQADGMRWQAMAQYYANQSPVKSENSFGAPGPSAGGAQGPTGVEVVSSTSNGGFDWSDASIGGAVAFGAALILLTAVGLGRRYRSHQGTGLANA
jgi:hypothetical protein